MNNMSKQFTHDKKKKLLYKINKLTSKKDMIKIYKIILNHKKDEEITKNNNGIFMLFHDLDDEVYFKLEKAINKILKNELSETLSAERKTYKVYDKENCPVQNGLTKKLKLSNTEKNLLKRKQYDENINSDSEKYITCRWSEH